MRQGYPCDSARRWLRTERPSSWQARSTMGGPSNATATLVTYLSRQGFQAVNVGHAAAVAYAVAVMAAAFSATQIVLFGRRQ